MVDNTNEEQTRDHPEPATPAADEATRKRIVTIASRAFSPRSLGLSSDERELGVRVLSIEMEPR